MLYTARHSEQLYPLDTHYADGRGAGTHNGAWVSLQNYHRAWFFLCVGDMEQAATLDAGLQQASDATGTGVKAIAGKTIAQLSGAAGDGSDLVCIELQTEQLDVDGGFEHVRFYVDIADGAVIYSATLFADCSRFKPVPTANWTEIVG